MAMISNLLRERFPAVVRRESWAYRAMQSAARTGDRYDKLCADWQRFRLARIEAENVLRAEAGLPLLSTAPAQPLPRGI